MKIGMLSCDLTNYPLMFEQLLCTVQPQLKFTVYDVLQEQYPGNIDDVDAYLITGSQFSVYDDEVWIHRLLQFVKVLQQRQKPIIAVCFGHQLIAQALGGKTQRSSKGWGVGIQQYHLSEEAKSLGFISKDDVFSLIATHQDQVVIPAKDTKVLAGNAFCRYGMCEVGEHILTLQGHPEFEKAYALNLYTDWRDNLGDNLFQQAKNSLQKDTSSLQIAEWMLNFLESKVR